MMSGSPFQCGGPEKNYCRDHARDDDGLLKFDSHVHSWYSSDSAVDPRSIVRLWERKRILSLVCDHNSISGSEAVYREITRLSPEIPVIMAEEIMTGEGEMIGLFLSEEIPAGLSAEDTLDIIRDQAALSLVPHPFCNYRSSTIRPQTLMDIIGRVDIIEGYNARIIRDQANRMAQEWASRHGKPVSVGSDAHTPLELGRCYIEMTPFSEPGEFLSGLREASVQFSTMHPSIHYLTKMVKIAKGNGFFRAI